MPKKPKRDNAYYEERLKNEFPSVYAEFQAGKYAMLADALVAAGLRKQRTRLQELMNAWSKATATERTAFLQSLAAAGAVVPVTSSTSGASFTVTVDRRLTPTAISRIEHIMAARRMKLGDLMNELGFNPLNASIGNAMKRKKSRLQPHVITALEAWLSKNSGI